MHTFEIPEGDAGVSRAISSDSKAPFLRVDLSFSPRFSANLYSHGTCVSGCRSRRRREEEEEEIKGGNGNAVATLVDIRPGEFSNRTDAEDVLEDIRCLYDAPRNT